MAVKLSRLHSETQKRVPVVVADRVGRLFRVPEQRFHTFKDRAPHPMPRVPYQSFSALAHVFFIGGFVVSNRTAPYVAENL